MRHGRESKPGAASGDRCSSTPPETREMTRYAAPTTHDDVEGTECNSKLGGWPPQIDVAVEAVLSYLTVVVT